LVQILGAGAERGGLAALAVGRGEPRPIQALLASGLVARPVHMVYNLFAVVMAEIMLILPRCGTC